MIVEIVQNKRDPERRLAFIKVTTKRFGEISIPAYADNGTPVGETEAMITGVAWHRNEHNLHDYCRPPKCAFIRVPTDEMRVRYRGFECSGSMCITDSSCYVVNKFDDTEDYVTFANWAVKDKSIRFLGRITPGRLQEVLIVADNVNTSFQNRKPPTPGFGWIKMNPNSGFHRIEGVRSFNELWI